MSTVLLQCCNGAAQIVKCSCDHVMETSCNDVCVVGIICVAIVIIAMYGICRFFTDRAKERECQKERESQKRIWEVEDKNREQESDKKNRDWSIEDQKRKQKSGLIDKLLDLQKSLTSPYEKDKNGTLTEKKYDKNEIEKYKAVLSYLLSISEEGSEKINLGKLEKAMGLTDKTIDPSNSSTSDTTTTEPS